MEVTRTNFEEVLAELESVISSSHFLAIDGEFTGLHTGQDVNAFDTPAQYYAKVRAGSMDFLLVQFGLCVFKYDKGNDKFTHEAYNFYVFPRPICRSAPDPRFLCQSSSLNFLVSQGFDFNQLFKNGIPYLRESDEKKLKESLEEKQKSRVNNSCSLKNGESPGSVTIPIPDQYSSAIEDVCVRIKDFLSKDEPDELVLDQCNGFVRKLIYQTVAENFDQCTVHLETRTLENFNRVLVVSRGGGEEERRLKEEEKQELERRELTDAVGFSSVIRLISRSGKLVIGHNMLLDLCHIVHQFCTSLPESYLEFKELMTFIFPRVLDTKFMSCSAPFKDHISSTVLGHLHKAMTEQPFELVSVDVVGHGKGYSSKEDKSHEAGYDAYITGVCFLTMANYLGSSENSKKKSILVNSSLLKPFINKMHLMKVQDLVHINLSGDDPIPPRKHVFHVTFPKEWKNYDLQQLFSPFGAVFIAWLNDSSAYVALYRREQAELVLKTLTQSVTYTVVPYLLYQKQQKELFAICQCQRNKNMLKKCHVVSGSPTVTARKRRSMELIEEQQQPLQSGPRKRSRSIGDYSKRSIEPIPEEEAEDPVTILQVNKCKEKLQVEGISLPSPNSTARTTNKKQFEENDTWG